MELPEIKGNLVVWESPTIIDTYERSKGYAILDFSSRWISYLRDTRVPPGLDFTTSVHSQKI